MPLPKIIIVGVAKCGTTALWYNLDKHPEIHMATRTDHAVEMHFWASKFRHKGLDWYSSRFDEGKIGGEKSTEYHNRIPCLRDIKEHIPDARIILCVRNPVDRAYSNLQMHQKKGGPNPFKKYIGVGRYINSVNKILKVFDEEQLFVCVAEHMKNDPTTHMKEVFDFVGVNDLALPKKEIHGVLLKDRSRQEDIKLSRSEPFYRVWSKHKKRLTGPERDKWLKHYRSYNKKLFEYLGYEIEEWKV